MGIHIIIGKNYGDEGKGLATDYFANCAKKEGKNILVVRHNGGAQAGHTVDTEDNRFIFHQLSSGSFRDAVTLWADTYMPDLYKITSELKDFKALSGKNIDIIGADNCRCVLIYDVLLNMAFEDARNDKRHGSCGMGINESVERSANRSFNITLGQIKGMSAESLAAELRRVRNDYVPYRIREMGFEGKLNDYYLDALQNENIPENTAQVMKDAAEGIIIVNDVESILKKSDEIIFEGAQGLMLDSENTADAPYLTSSRTGLCNPIRLCKKHLYGIKPEIVYVTRSYITRHGEGPLLCEEEWSHIKDSLKLVEDKTNIPNEWQGKLRYAPHMNEMVFFEGIKKDFEDVKNTYKNKEPNILLSLMITHLNETGGKLVFRDRMYTLEEFQQFSKVVNSVSKVYCSYSRYSNQMKITDT